MKHRFARRLWILFSAMSCLFFISKSASSGECADLINKTDLNNNWNHIIEICQIAAQNNEPAGFTAMGIAHAEGQGGLPVNTILSLRYLERADWLGESLATAYMGRMYLEGRLIAQDKDKANMLLLKAMAVGQGMAAYYLAQQYEQGLGVTADINEAERLYFLAAAVDYPPAKVWLKLHPNVTETKFDSNLLNLFDDTSDLYKVIVKYRPDGPEINQTLSDYLREQMERNFPRQAQDSETNGVTSVDCSWDQLGNARNCFVYYEEPLGYGFGLATVKALTKPVQFTNKSDWAKKAYGKSVRMTLNWRLN
jgi:TPR repeat protein